MLTLNFALTKEDYCNFYLHVMWDDLAKQKKRKFHYVKQVGTAALFVTVFYFSGLFNRNSSFAYIVISLLLLTSILSITSLKSSLRNQAKVISDDIDNSSIFLQTRLVLNESEIILTNGLIEQIFKWAAIIRMQENKEYYFLFYNASEAIIIPKRLLKSTQIKSTLDDLLNKYLTFDAFIGYQID